MKAKLVESAHLAAFGTGLALMTFMFSLQGLTTYDPDWLRLVGVLGLVIFTMSFFVARGVELDKLEISESVNLENALFVESRAQSLADFEREGGCSCDDCHAGH